MSPISSTGPKILSDFSKFSEFVLNNQKQMTPKIFSQQLGYIQGILLQQNKENYFVKKLINWPQS